MMLKPLLLSWLVVLAFAVLFSFNPSPHALSRLAAAMFLVAVVVLAVYEFGWDKPDNNA